MMSQLSEQLLVDVRKNKERLDACKGHDFQPITPGLFGTRYFCTNCKGSTDGVSVLWYQAGRAHASAQAQA